MSATPHPAALAAWNYLGGAARTGAQLGIGLALARLLGPEAFGMMAPALMLTMFAGQIADAGLTTLLVTGPDGSDRLVSSILARQSALALILALIVAGAAPVLAGLLGQPQAGSLIAAAALLIVLQVAARVPVALLRRQLAFRRLQILQLVAYLLAFGAGGLTLAALGWGAWALCVAAIGQAAIVLLLAWWAARPRLVRPAVRLTPDQERFALASLGASAAGSIYGHWETAVVSRCLGATALGLHNRVQVLTTTLAHGTAEPLQSVLQAWLARHRDDRAAICGQLATTLVLAWLIALPAAVIALADPHAVILLLLGPGWEGCVPLLTPMVLAGLLYLLMVLQLPALTAVGDARSDLRVQVTATLVAIPALLWAAGHSLPVVAWTVLALAALRLALLTVATARNQLAEPGWLLLDVLRCSLAPLLAAGLAWVALRALDAGIAAPALACLLAYAILATAVWLAPRLTLPVAAAVWLLERRRTPAP